MNTFYFERIFLIRSLQLLLNFKKSFPEIFVHSYLAVVVLIPFHKLLGENQFPKCCPYKVSYSCVGNISSIILSRNKNILHPVSNTEYEFNCISKESCLLQNWCLTPKLVYQADIKNPTNDEKKFYLEVTGTLFKERFSNHTWHFKHLKYLKYRNSTELSKYIWKFKDAIISLVF